MHYNLVPNNITLLLDFWLEFRVSNINIPIIVLCIKYLWFNECAQLYYVKYILFIDIWLGMINFIKCTTVYI